MTIHAASAVQSIAMRALLLVAALLALTAAPADAQQRAPVALEPSEEMEATDFDKRSRERYSMPGALIPCLKVVPDMSNGHLEDDCFGDPFEEDAAREDVKSADRSVRAGLLMVGTLWNAVLTVRDIVVGGNELYRGYKQIVAGFDRDRPEVTVIRLGTATDDAATYSENVLALSPQVSYRSEREESIDMLLRQALARASDADEAARSMSAQTGAMQTRLANGNVDVYEMGSGGLGSAAPLPPLPADAPPEAWAEYERTSRDDWSYKAPVMSAGRIALVAQPAAFGAGPARAGAAGGGSGGACAILDAKYGVDDQDPAVLNVRATVMYDGLLTGAASPTATLAATQARLQLMREAETERRRESALRRLMHFLRNM